MLLFQCSVLKKYIGQLGNTRSEIGFEKQKAEALELRNKIEETDKEIDKLVYKLYDLTYEEVKIVDPGTGISEGEYLNQGVNYG